MMPPATASTENATSNCTQGQASELWPSSAAPNACEAPSITGVTAGRTRRGTSVSRARSPVASTP